MSNYTLFQLKNSNLQDPEIKKFIDDVADSLKAETYQAIYHLANNKRLDYKKLKVGGKQIKEYESVGAVINKWASKKNPQLIKAIANNRGSRIFLDSSRIKLSRFYSIRSERSLFDSALIKPKFYYINDSWFKRFINRLNLVDPDTKTETEVAAPNYPLKLNLKTIKCLDETNPEWPGSDEIFAGGVTVDDKENHSIIKEFDTGSYDDNTTRHFNKVLKSFVLDKDNPSTFLAFLSLAEKDSGGFASFLVELYEAVKAHLEVILMSLGAAAGAAIGAAIGGSIGTTVGGPLGLAIGAAAGLILGALVGWLASAFHDEIFEPQITGITINKHGKFTGPTQRLVFSDFGGSYAMDVFWSAG